MNVFLSFYHKLLLVAIDRVQLIRCNVTDCGSIQDKLTLDVCATFNFKSN